MTELALRADTSLALASDPTGGRLVAWAQAASAANQLAKALVQTTFVPESYKVRGDGGAIDPGNATAAIIMGDELGMSPLAALRGIYIYKGNPALYARTMRALALSHGHQMWNEKSTDEEVIVCGRRRGSDRVERAVWTIARATKAGYVASNSKYKSDPQAMLQSKADSEIARKIAADVLAGVPYSVEDLELEDVASSSTTTVAPSAPKRVARRTVTAAPVVEEPAFDEPEDVQTIQAITPAQLRKLHAAMGDAGLSDRDAGLEYLSEQVGREVTTSKDLTKDEASRVIDRLEQVNADPVSGELLPADPAPAAWSADELAVARPADAG